MQIGINDLDDDDFGTGFEVNDNPPKEEDINLPPVSQPSEDDFIADYLKSKGIDDINKIKFEDDNNLIVERDWDSLSKEEKINILNTPIEAPSYQQNDNQLSEEEMLLLNTIRQSNLTPSEYLQQIQGQLGSSEPLYKVDDLSDDELYLLDLESRVGELSDEDAAQALNNAKQNEELFKKQTEGIRKEYKEREDFLNQQELAAYELELQEAFNVFLDSVITSIGQFNSIGNLDLNLEDSDKEELAQFMLSRDEAGNNYLWQALQDPETLVKAAWFILNGDEAFNNISDYFINLIKLVSQNQYKKGYEEGKSGKNPSRPLVVINNKQQLDQHRLYNSINDLDDED